MELSAMPFDGTSSVSLASASSFADRVDLIAADAHEMGLGQAAVILAQMAGLLRSLGDTLNISGSDGASLSPT